MKNIFVNRFRLTIIFIFLSLLLHGVAAASGFRIVSQGAKATGMGNAFTATADDPSTIFYNPAGLIQMKGTNIYIGTAAVIPATKYTSPAGPYEYTDDQVFFPPHLYVSSDFGMEKMSFGVGVYSPFGLGTKWDEEGIVRYEATETELATLNINPTVSFNILPNVSLGFGINYMRSSVLLEKMVDQSLVSGNDGRFRLEGDGDGWGYNAGILYKPVERMSIGLAYRSRVKIDYRGSARLKNIAQAVQQAFGGDYYETDADTGIEFPDIFNIGIAYRLTERFTLEVDGEWTRWSAFDSLDVKLDKEVIPAGFVDSSTRKDWNDEWAVKLGIEYRAAKGFFSQGRICV
ncbi:MAG: hypothetical protein E3K32_03475 [wastewater metagenome]|nr:hypothetical protein [Candidatus Loosdrechtia aerotolerans]